MRLKHKPDWFFIFVEYVFIHFHGSRMSQQQNGFEYMHKDGEVPFWLEDITKWVDV